MAKSKQQAVVNINYSIELLFMCIVDVERSQNMPTHSPLVWDEGSYC